MHGNSAYCAQAGAGAGAVDAHPMQPPLCPSMCVYEARFDRCHHDPCDSMRQPYSSNREKVGARSGTTRNLGRRRGKNWQADGLGGKREPKESMQPPAVVYQCHATPRPAMLSG